MTRSKLVSCLMVTKPRASRYSYFLKSIDAYLNQTFSTTELIVALGGGEPDAERAASEHIVRLNRSDIRIVRQPGPLTLGAVRNLSEAEAQGEFLCQWDDDDLHHPDRVRRQLDTLCEAEAGACYLQEALQFLAGPRELYWTNWLMTPAGAQPGTMMRRRGFAARYPEAGKEAALGEDTALLADLRQETTVTTLGGEPHLFVYVTHGNNVWPADHHRMLIERLSLSKALLRLREAQIREWLAGAPLGPGAITAMGSNGPAFTIGGEGDPPT
jgi:glycosyltransferase involved in cell wall biosynthesis